MKKTFKRTIACLLAVLMVISSLPFTAFAEDNSVQPVVDDGVGVTCSMRNYGVFTDLKGGSDRFRANNWIDITNDGTSDTFTIGYINFDISGITASEFDEIHGDFTLRHQKWQKELVPLQVMYPTKNQALFDNQTSVAEGDKLNVTAFNSIWKDGGYAQNAKEYFGLEKIGTFTYDAYMSSPKDDTIDVGPAIQQALKAGLDYATVVFLLANEDSNGNFVDGKSGSYYTDTYVYFDNLTVKRVFNFKAIESTTVQKPASLTVETANATPKTGTSSYSIGGVTMPADYSNNVLYCSSTTEANKTYVQNHYVRRISVTPLNSVLMYDGSGNNPAMPIMFGFQPSNDGDKNIFLCNAYLDWEGTNFKAGQFTGCKPLKSQVIDGNFDKNGVYALNFTFDDKDTIDFTKIEDKDRIELSTDSKKYDKNYPFTTKEYPVSNGACYFWNKMEFYGSFNENGGFKKFQNPNVSIGIKNRAGGIGFTWQDVSDKTYPKNANVYVLNYKPIYDVLSNNEAGKVSTLGGNYTFKDLYNTVWANEKEFSPAAVNRYYSAVEKLISIDPQAELANCADDQVESKVKELGVKIKTAYSRYVSAAQDLKYSVSWDAYNEAETESSNILNANKDQYTSDSLAAYKTEVDKIYADQNNAFHNSATTQAKADALTNQLLSAKSLLRKKSITITYRVFKNNKEKAESEESQPYTYGASAKYSYTCAPGESITAWTVKDEINHAYTRVGTSEANFSLVATRDLYVDVYVTTKQVSTAEYSKVTFIGPGGNIIDIKYVEKDKTLDKSQFPTAPEIPFYTFNNIWSQENVKGTGKDIEVYARYSVGTQNCRVHFNNNELSYYYDELVKLDGYDSTKKYALAKDADGKNIITYLDRDSFHAPRTDDIYVVEVSETEAKIGITGNFGDTDSEGRKLATYNCKFYLPAGYTAVEWGLEINNGKTTKQAQSNVQNDYNEYSVTVRYKSTSTVKKITCRAYLTYKTSDQYVTIYSDPVEQAISTL